MNYNRSNKSQNNYYIKLAILRWCYNIFFFVYWIFKKKIF